MCTPHHSQTIFPQTINGSFLIRVVFLKASNTRQIHNETTLNHGADKVKIRSGTLFKTRLKVGHGPNWF